MLPFISSARSSYAAWAVGLLAVVAAAAAVSATLNGRSAVPELDPAVLRGAVVDESTGAPVARARLSLAPARGAGASGAGFHAVSDSAGAYAFAEAPAGRAVLTVVADGYAPAVLHLDSGAGGGAPVDVALASEDRRGWFNRLRDRLYARPQDRDRVMMSRPSPTPSVAAAASSLGSAAERRRAPVTAAPSDPSAARPSTGASSLSSRWAQTPPRGEAMSSVAASAVDRSGARPALEHPFETPFPYDERYAVRRESGWRNAGASPHSTFSVDVDTAGYAAVRRDLEAGRRPARDAVKVEEFINYFDYGWTAPGPDGPRVAVSSEVAPSPWSDGMLAARVGVRAAAVDPSSAPPVNIVLLFDESGSMSGRDRLDLLKNAAKLLARALRPDDRVSVVSFSGRPRLRLASLPASQFPAIEQAINGLRASGSTAGADGLELAYREARRRHVDGCVFRRKWNTDFGRSGTSISAEVEHRFREVEHGFRDVEHPFREKWNAGSGVVNARR